MKIRKQVYELTKEDLEACPIWEFALDEEGEADQDEATVRPYPISNTINSAEGMFILRAHFLLSDGTPHIGYLTPSEDASDLSTIQPQIVTEKGQVGFWLGMVPANLAESYSILGKSPDEIFPIGFTSDIEISGKILSGTIPAFMQLEDFKTMKVKELK